MPQHLACKDVKGRAAGKRALSTVKAFGANGKKPRVEKLAQNLSKAQSRYEKTFAAVEQRGGCATVGDSAAVAALADGFVGAVLSELCTATTTVASSTTSTTMPGSSTTSTTLVPGAADLVITEVLYDPAAADDGFEWVELRNLGPTSVDLSGFSLGYGGADYTAGTVTLSGVIPAGGIFVVGGPGSDGTNGEPAYDLVINFSPDIQNGGTVGDGIALFAGPASAITASTVPLDAVVYGPNNDSGLIDETGVAGPPDVDDAPAGSSIERVTAAGDWQVQDVPTPNATPF